MFLAKSSLYSIEVVTSRILIDLYISHVDSVSNNNVLKEYDDMKEAIENLKISTFHQRFSFIYKIMLSYCLKCRKV